MFNLFPQHPAPYLGPADWKQGASMTLRDHFAGLAMQALVARRGGGALGAIETAEVTEEAYILADAMLKARDEQ